jgi:hypothetical protein
VGRCQAAAGQARLQFAERRERRLHLALEALLDDEFRLPVAQENEDRV